MDNPRRVMISRKNGSLVLEWAMKRITVFGQDETLNLLFADLPKDGNCAVYEIKKLKE